MALTENKAKVISEYLMADKDRGEHLLTLAPEEAAKEMNDDGCGVTAEDLIEFGAAMTQVADKEELEATDLDNVAGGLGVVATYAAACGIAFVAGYAVKRIEKW